jgi:hypothetical protein
MSSVCCILLYRVNQLYSVTILLCESNRQTTGSDEIWEKALTQFLCIGLRVLGEQLRTGKETPQMYSIISQKQSKESELKCLG